ncbi:MAG: precorrin-3B C(17)-methyltransferase [Acidiphilium sp. 37-64-53]|uniref:precorrin-3B C(17)-methyltransferase n=1 Tax=Acidiphilium TaxID=522 RepID=UPI000BD5FA23|nr:MULTISPECIES: precorrin-3B C(17)-methyltransferase [Acidiphilium]OYW03647.1 MAG: precorrin-3B C(17)-methyltransferase [Acidiphilium sp. 37-64-53]OZB29742.1 MAG: precorrin-3B C(17)-methyltransferase [Acidiphilium sp. 34-64-41]HQT84254.1 precorrin-3B C(17)-methyltransferase [Acidiphilium rubrum]
MSGAGRLIVVGLGPGDPAMQTPQAAAALAAATDLIGYGPYLARVPARPGVVQHPTDNRVELDRARHALTLAAAGRVVVVVSSGDAGVFAMASAVFEAIDHGEAAWRALDVSVVPGISALLAVAARVGAPLGHDFCAISLSDNLKPWDLVEQRLVAAAGAGFVLALYNPASRARPWQIGRCFEVLRGVLPGSVPVIFATAVSRADEAVTVVRLDAADPALADMRTLVLVGSAATRMVAREAGTPWVYTPRGVG